MQIKKRGFGMLVDDVAGNICVSLPPPPLVAPPPRVLPLPPDLSLDHFSTASRCNPGSRAICRPLCRGSKHSSLRHRMPFDTISGGTLASGLSINIGRPQAPVRPLDQLVTNHLRSATQQTRVNNVVDDAHHATGRGSTQ